MLPVTQGIAALILGLESSGLIGPRSIVLGAIHQALNSHSRLKLELLSALSFRLV
jgi:hypothetical protein